MKLWTASAVLLALGILAAGPASAQRPNREDFRKRLLEKYDKDKDGKLSEEERAAARKDFQARRGERPGGERGSRPLPEFLKKYDTDKDGKLSEEERAAARKARMAEILKKYDKDGDGKLNEEERAAARKDFQARRGGQRPGGERGSRPLPEFLKKFDKDGDGKLSEEERAEARKSLGERRRQGRQRPEK